MNDTLTIAGVTPRDVVTPRDLDELATIVRDLYGARKAFAFVGGGTELEFGNAPRALDTVVRTTKLDRVVDYTPEDQTITVEAGITFAALDQLLAIYGQMLPLDVGDRERATLGGAIATNAYGRRRQRYGTAKDLIVGVQIVRADGVVARGGGKVVKNVAGFDIPKLMVGSLGTLGAIATVTLRLYPLPEARRSFVLSGGTDLVERTCAAIVAERLEPEALVLYGSKLGVTFAGTQAGVDAQAATLLGPITAASACGAEEIGADDEFAAAERAVRTESDWRIRITTPPRPPAQKHGFDYYAGSAGSVAYPLLGVELRAFAYDRLPEAVRDDRPDLYINDLRKNVAETGGDVVVHAMPLAAREHVDAWSTFPPPELPLMRAIKTNFDPHGLCNPGRFIGGL